MIAGLQVRPPATRGLQELPVGNPAHNDRHGRVSCRGMSRERFGVELNKLL
jgi:hypothetical protein